MHRSLVEKFKEAFTSVLPITIIVMLLHFTISPMPLGTVVLFITGTILLVIGMSIFTLGVDMAIMPIGEFIGASLVKSRKLLIFVIGSFILGVAVTVAEPDLQVLAKQVPSVPDVVLLGSVAIGVGIFLVISLLRILFKMRLSYILLIMYSIVFLVAAFTSPDYLAVAFDSGGVATGPITVPFILALGMGVSTVSSGKSAEEDSFGLCGISSIGPIIAVLIMGIFFDSSGGGYGFETASTVNNLSELLSLYKDGIFVFFKEVTIAFSPIILIFAAYNIFYLKLPKRQIAKIAVGIVYAILGLTIFLTGVNIGFMPAGNYLGNSLASLSYNWILIPLSVLIGFFIVAAEPAVHVLNKQVEDITSGSISKKMMMAGLSLGVGIALALAMIRMMFEIKILFFLLPAYIIALALTFFVPQIFTAIAFDSGGVASGTMAATFLLPFAIGVSSALGGNPMTDAFGIIAMVAMMPLITVQIMGVIYMVKMKRNKDIIDYKEDDTELNDEDDFDIIEY